VIKPNGNGAIPPWVLELIATVGGEHELHAETLGRLTKHPRLVSGRRRKKQNSFHQIRATCSALGSAQQYQGSLR
jgi:hypothetical protein